MEWFLHDGFKLPRGAIPPRSLGTYLNEWSREFEGESGTRYKVSVVDTWGMTEEELPGTFEGKFRIDLPSKQYMMLRLTQLAA